MAISGSRFAYLMGEAVLLELALVQWVTRLLVDEGFTPVVPPVLVREQAMVEAGFFPTDRAQVYEVDGGELFLVGTSEVPLVGAAPRRAPRRAVLPCRYARDLDVLPARGGHVRQGHPRHLPCAPVRQGRDVLVRPIPTVRGTSTSALLAIEERIVGDLGLPYRVVNIAAGDLGAAAAKKYDIEVWLPSEGRYRELTSCSNYLDYSARRLSTRVRAEGGNRSCTRSTAPRAPSAARSCSCFEHYQDADGALRRCPTCSGRSPASTACQRSGLKGSPV